MKVRDVGETETSLTSEESVITTSSVGSESRTTVYVVFSPSVADEEVADWVMFGSTKDEAR